VTIQELLPFVVLIAGLGVALIIAEVAERAEARRRAKERAEDRALELARFAIERQAHKRQTLRKARQNYVELAEVIGGMPQPIADAIANIDQQLAEIKAEQIRKMTEAAQP
jgi:hypothetical protein